MPLFLAFSMLFTFFAPVTKHDNQVATLLYWGDFGAGTYQTREVITQDQNAVDFSYQSKPFRKLRGIRLGVTGAYTKKETYLAGGMFSKTSEIGRLGITFGESINYTGISKYDAARISGPVNFKTTLDFTYPLTKRIHAGVGLLHISNGGYQTPNSGINAIRAGLYIMI